MKNGVLLLFLFSGVFVLSNTLFAQKYPLELYSARINDSASRFHEGEVGVETRHGSIILPILPFDSFQFMLYLRETTRRFDYDNFDEPVTLQETSRQIDIDDFPEKLTLSTIGGFLLLSTENGSWLIRHDIVTASDSKEIDEKDKGYLDQVLYNRGKDTDGRWSFGMARTGGIMDDFYVPLLGYRYKGDTLDINMMAPTYLILQLRLSEHWYVLYDETVELDNYRLTEEEPWNDSVASLASLIYRLELGMRTEGGFEAGLSYGYVSHRWWIIRDSDGEKEGRFDLKDSQFISFQIQLLL